MITRQEDYRAPFNAYDVGLTNRFSSSLHLSLKVTPIQKEDHAIPAPTFALTFIKPTFFHFHLLLFHL